jgi:ferrous iron transport protein A
MKMRFPRPRRSVEDTRQQSYPLPRNHRKICRLNDLKPGYQGRIRRHHSAGAIRRRLLDLGLVPDTTVSVVCFAPLNDPILLKLENDQIALRRHEAALIEVEALGDDAVL